MYQTCLQQPITVILLCIVHILNRLRGLGLYLFLLFIEHYFKKSYLGDAVGSMKAGAFEVVPDMLEGGRQIWLIWTSPPVFREEPHCDGGGQGRGKLSISLKQLLLTNHIPLERSGEFRGDRPALLEE